MTYSNDQGNPNANIPMWQVMVPPVPDAQGRFPSDPGNPNAAVPVFEVPAPGAVTGPYPTDQGYIIASGNGKGAMPVRVVAGPPTPDAQGRYTNDPTLDSSAKPMWVVGSTTGILTVYPSDQDLSDGAQPIYVV